MKNTFARFSSLMQIHLFFLLILTTFPQTLIADTSQVSSETKYFELYANILRNVEEGKLDAVIGTSARSLNSELQDKISPIDDNIMQLKADFGGLSDKDRDSRLEQLMREAAKKERIYNQYNQKLASLLHGHTAGKMGKTAPPQQENNNISAPTSSPREKEEESLPLNIKLEPENVMKGDFE